MHARFHLLPFLVPALAAAAALAAGVPSPDSHDLVVDLRAPDSAAHLLDVRTLRPRDGDHDHHGGGMAVDHWNETKFLEHHDPTPESYWTYDVVSPVPEGEHRYPGLMALHIFSMCAAFFGALPVGIIYRSTKHAWHGAAVVAFYGLSAIGVGSSMLYRKLTPDLYEHNVHGAQGYFWLLWALALTTIDAGAFLLRAFSYAKAVRSGEEAFSFKGAWHTVVLARDAHAVSLSSEYEGLVNDEPQLDEGKDMDDDDEMDSFTNAPRHEHRRQPSFTPSERTLGGSPRRSDETLHELPPRVLAPAQPRAPLRTRIAKGVFAVAERVLVFAGFMQLLTGTAVYTGGCRGDFVHGCAAHLIKGGIFWCYGLVTFARYLGAFAEIGWAWNAPPRGARYPTAEFVESLVVCVYGASNTWMERFHAAPGAPYTTKEIQHISIAVMFWAAGLVGLGIESRAVRRWLAAHAAAGLPAGQAVRAPPSYRGGFNPFPALCIGITGLAMSAHWQEYRFQVEIHALWGALLAGFAALRCGTYFFLWLRPPAALLPSRPPTEALASFCLACGGLVFVFSAEDVTVAAMRQGRDDVMMVLNLSVAITCCAMCWVLAVVGYKGFLRSRTVAVRYVDDA